MMVSNSLHEVILVLGLQIAIDNFLFFGGGWGFEVEIFIWVFLSLNCLDLSSRCQLSAFIMLRLYKGLGICFLYLKWMWKLLVWFQWFETGNYLLHWMISRRKSLAFRWQYILLLVFFRIATNWILSILVNTIPFYVLKGYCWVNLTIDCKICWS